MKQNTSPISLQNININYNVILQAVHYITFSLVVSLTPRKQHLNPLNQVYIISNDINGSCRFLIQFTRFAISHKTMKLNPAKTNSQQCKPIMHCRMF